jgi:hypothetical protein
MDFEPITRQEFDILSSPRKYCTPHSVKRHLEDFLSLNCFAARVIISPGEYKNTASLRSSLSSAVQRYYRQTIQVLLVQNEVYLINTGYKEEAQ